MSPQDYRAYIKSFGLSPCKASFEGKTLHQTREGQFQQVPDPESLSLDERDATIALLKSRLMITDQ